MLKTISKGFFVLILLICSGCSSVNVVEGQVYSSLYSFRVKEVPKLIKYMDADTTLSTRDRNTFETSLRLFDLSLSELKSK